LRKTVDNREAEIKKYIQKINDEEDKIFQDFVKKIGVENIRQYDEQQLRQVKEQTEKLIKFSTQISQIRSQLDYEEQRNLKVQVDNFTESINKDTATLTNIKKQEDDILATINNVKEQIEAIEKQVSESKKKLDEQEITLKELKKKWSCCYPSYWKYS